MLESFGSSVTMDLILRISTYEWEVMMQYLMTVRNGGQKWSADASLVQTTLNRRAPRDYKEKDSNDFKVFANLYPAGHYNYEMEVVNFDYLIDVSNPDATPRGRGRPGKVVNHRSNARFQRQNQDLMVMLGLGLAEEECLELIATARDQGKVLVALSSPRRKMENLKIKAAALEYINAIAAKKLLEAQEIVDTEMEEASVARIFLKDGTVNNATEIAEDATDVTEMQEDTKNRWSRMNKYSATKLFQHLNWFCKGRWKCVQHAKCILNMAPLRYLLIGFVIVFLRETLFTKKWSHAVDMNQGLNLSGLDVIRSM
jgi:hypothetical protein